MKDPAFLFYSGDFLAGVQDLTMEERGQYITLLCLQHQKGHLSEKIIRLAVADAAADVMAKFRQDENGLWFNSRLQIESEKRVAHSEKQRKRAIEGWETRKSKATAYTTADAAALPLENVNRNRNENVIDNESSIPELHDFLKYALSKDKTLDHKSVELKYESWKENGWKVERSGKLVKIMNWKTTLLNTIPYLKKREKNGIFNQPMN